MTRKESRWLLSVMLSVMLGVTMLFNPAMVMATGTSAAASTDKTVSYINSDGSETTAYQTSDGFVYEEVNSDGTDVAKIRDYTGGRTKIKVPDKLGGLPVVSFAIDPRNPGVAGTDYDVVQKISLPASVAYAHTHFMRFFDCLNTIEVAKANPVFKSIDGIMYRLNAEGCTVSMYPRAKADTNWTMPKDLTESYSFFEDCPLETINVSNSIGESFRAYSLRKLENLKNVNINGQLGAYSTDDGVLYWHREKWDEDDNLIGYSDEKFLKYYPPARRETTFKVSEGTVGVAIDDFKNNISLEHLVLPAAIQSISCDDLDVCPNFKTLEFTGKTLFLYEDEVAESEFLDYYGLRELYQKRDLKIIVPEDGKKYDKLFEYLNSVPSDGKVQEINSWSYDISEYGPYSFCEGENLYFSQTPEYGYDKMRYEFQDVEGHTLTEAPTAIGEYRVRFVVDETDEYTGLKSDWVDLYITYPEIDQADNWWINREGYYSISYGKSLEPKFIPRYGTAKIEYRDADDESADWIEDVPTAVGRYLIRATVEETERYAGLLFGGQEYDEETGEEAFFEIEQAWNDWEEELTCPDIYLGETPQAHAKALYGEVVYTYYTPDGEVFTGAPTEPGSYRVKAAVEGTLEYRGCRDFAEFQVRSEEAEQNAQKVVDMIGKLPSSPTVEDEGTVKAAQKAYSELTRYEQSLVPKESLKAMTRAVKAVKLQKAEAKAGKEAAEDKEVADQVIADKVSKIPARIVTAVTAAQRKAVKEARAAYEALTDDQKAQFSPDALASIVKAEKAIKNIDAYNAKVKKAKAVKVKSLKATAKKGKKATVTWKAVKGVSGYQIKYGLNKKVTKKAKTINVKSAKAKKATLTKLKAKKTYYVKIRTYTKIKHGNSGKTSTIYGKWTAVKKFKSKK